MASSLALKKLVSSTLVPNSLRSIRPIASITPLASSRLFNTNALRDYDGLSFFFHWARGDGSVPVRTLLSRTSSSSPSFITQCSTSSPSLLTDAHTAIERPVIRNMNCCNDSFWRDIEILTNSDVETFINGESRTRKFENVFETGEKYQCNKRPEEAYLDISGRELGTWDNMAYYLQLYGPSVLRDVPKMEIMISEKKLVQETAHSNKPFKSYEEAEMEKEIIRLKKLIKIREKEKKARKKKIDELNAEKENLEKIIEELKIPEEEIMKAKFDATSN